MTMLQAKYWSLTIGQNELVFVLRKFFSSRLRERPETYTEWGECSVLY